MFHGKVTEGTYPICYLMMTMETLGIQIQLEGMMNIVFFAFCCVSVHWRSSRPMVSKFQMQTNSIVDTNCPCWFNLSSILTPICWEIRFCRVRITGLSSWNMHLIKSTKYNMLLASLRRIWYLSGISVH